MYRGKALWATVVVFVALWLPLAGGPDNGWQAQRFHRLSERDVEFARQLDRLGRSYVAQADFGRAIVAFSFLLKKFPAYEDADGAMVLVGICLGQLGDAEMMADTFSEFLFRFPKSKYADHVREVYNHLRDSLAYRRTGGVSVT